MSAPFFGSEHLVFPIASHSLSKMGLINTSLFVILQPSAGALQSPTAPARSIRTYVHAAEQFGFDSLL